MYLAHIETIIIYSYPLIVIILYTLNRINNIILRFENGHKNFQKV